MTLAALWLAPVEGVGLVGAAATRLVTPKTAELCVLAVPAAPPWPGPGDRLVREVADALRAQGAERVVARRRVATVGGWPCCVAPASRPRGRGTRTVRRSGCRSSCEPRSCLTGPG